MNASPCKSCHSKWPYLFILFIAVFVSLVTWLTLGTTETLSTAAKITSSLGAFLIVFAVLFSYIFMCLRRHCGHQSEYVEEMS